MIRDAEAMKLSQHKNTKTRQVKNACTTHKSYPCKKYTGFPAHMSCMNLF